MQTLMKKFQHSSKEFLKPISKQLSIETFNSNKLLR